MVQKDYALASKYRRNDVILDVRKYKPTCTSVRTYTSPHSLNRYKEREKKERDRITVKGYWINYQIQIRMLVLHPGGLCELLGTFLWILSYFYSGLGRSGVYFYSHPKVFAQKILRTMQMSSVSILQPSYFIQAVDTESVSFISRR